MPDDEPVSEGFLLERALRTAAIAHRGQLRKGGEVPYFAHAAAVALILARAGFTEETLLAAALLHDVVEDTDVTLDELAAKFPPDVIALVTALSETKTDAAGRLRPWEDRKAEHLRQIAAAPQEARVIALADKLHNMATLRLDLAAGTIALSAFRAPPERLLWYYRSTIDAAAGDDARLEPLAEMCRAEWDRLRRALSPAAAG
jgi:guanosine-3',5'-bis(diphosphate) 3'-pyrophosphohydrolase